MLHCGIKSRVGRNRKETPPKRNFFALLTRHACFFTLTNAHQMVLSASTFGESRCKVGKTPRHSRAQAGIKAFCI
jgi:hypothetical protein